MVGLPQALARRDDTHEVVSGLRALAAMVPVRGGAA